MSDLDIVNEHDIIRETVGYDGIKDVELWDLPEVLRFLKIVYNYQRMNRFIEKDKDYGK